MTVVMKRPATLASTFDKMLDEFFRTDFPKVNGNDRQVLTRPAANILESANDFRLQLAVPGLEKEDFVINIEKDVLTISAEKNYEVEEGVEFKRQEFGNIQFERRYQLPEMIDTEGIQAKYENGILNVTLPKREEAKEKPARKVEIA